MLQAWLDLTPLQQILILIPIVTIVMFIKHEGGFKWKRK